MINFSMKKSGFGKPLLPQSAKSGPNAIHVGVFGEQGSDLVIYAASNEFGTEVAGRNRDMRIPERSFIRDGLLEKQREIKEFIQEIYPLVLSKQITKTDMLHRLGQFVTRAIQTKIVLGPFEANKASTIAKKKSSRPLIDTGRLRQSITYKLV